MILLQRVVLSCVHDISTILTWGGPWQVWVAAATLHHCIVCAAGTHSTLQSCHIFTPPCHLLPFATVIYCHILLFYHLCYPGVYCHFVIYCHPVKYCHLIIYCHPNILSSHHKWISRRRRLYYRGLLTTTTFSHYFKLFNQFTNLKTSYFVFIIDNSEIFKSTIHSQAII